MFEEVITFHKDKSKKLPTNVIDFDHVIFTRSDPKLPSISFDPKNDTVMLPYSSGTTGLAKGVMLTHYNISAMIAIRQRFVYFVNTPAVFQILRHICSQSGISTNEMFPYLLKHHRLTVTNNLETAEPR